MSHPTGSRKSLAEAVRVLARLARGLERTCQDSGMTLPQYRLLSFVAREPQRAGELASMTSVSRPALTDLVDGLERHGLLRRIPVEGDRRGVHLELTPTGRKTLKETERQLMDKIGALLEEAGRPDLIDGLAGLGEALDAQRRAAEAKS